MSYLLKLSDPRAKDVQLAGQKAATLAKLSGLAFPVPPGIVATTALCREVFAAIRPGAEFVPEDVLRKLKLPEAFDEELRTVLAAHPAERRFAVRSSSPEEDSSAASFAGQFDTYLNCCGHAAIRDAILKCLLSLWSPRVIAYRQFHKLTEAGTIAVLIQEMIDCDVSGVAFSLQPVSGDLTKIVINAHAGLGEAVVDGESHVQEYVLQKDTLAIVSEEECRGPDKRLLNADDLARLGAVVTKLEALNAFPQDVEWGIAAGELALLQSRPVSAFPATWTRDRSAERFPYAMTPFIWSVIEKGFHLSLKFSFNLMGLPPFSGRWFSSHEHHVYANGKAREIYARRMAIPMRHLRDGSSGLRPMLQEMAWLYQPLDHWDRNIDIYLDEVMALTRYSLEGKTLAQLWSYIHRIRDIAYRNFTPNIAIAQGHAMLMRALTATVTALAGAERSNVLMSELTTGCKTKTGLFNEELKSLAALVASRPGLEERVRHDASQEALDAILADAEASAAFERFLSAHYHREIDHFLDPYYPSLGERPLVLVDNIKMRLDAAGRLDTNKSTNRHRQALATIMSLCPKDHRPDLLELVELTRTYVGLDDTEHYQTGRLHTPTRRCMRAIGRMLVEAGLIEEELDVCFAGFDALEKAVLHNFWGELVADVRANKASFLKACSSPPPWSLEQRSEDAAGDGSVYIGLACSSGVVEGVVKIVRTSDDFRNIRPGDILVARATPPAWTALFYSVAGVITEAGSALSHGAVIAREVGIPAVMGLRGILDAFQDGDRVRVDGSAGRVFRLIESAPRTDP